MLCAMYAEKEVEKRVTELYKTIRKLDLHLNIIHEYNALHHLITSI